jgi:hypothetical protein
MRRQEPPEGIPNSLFLAETRECKKLMGTQEPPEDVPRLMPGNVKIALLHSEFYDAVKLIE